MNNPKIYVGCALNNASPDFIESVQSLKKKLGDDYHILDFAYPPPDSDSEVYRHDIEHCVRNADLFIAICDQPSTGLGWELCEAMHLNIPTIALAHEDSSVSKLITGAAELMPKMKLIRYQDLELEAPSVIRDHFDSLK